MFFKSTILFSFPLYSVMSSVLTSSPHRVFLENMIYDNMRYKVKENIQKTYVPKSELELEQEAKLDRELEQKFEEEVKSRLKPKLRQIVAFSHPKRVHGTIINWREVNPVINDEILKSDAFKSILIDIEKYTHSLQYKYIVFKDMITLKLLVRCLGGGKDSEMYEKLIIKVDNNVDILNDEITHITENVMQQVNIEFS
jgi:hypothetical protein